VALETYAERRPNIIFCEHTIGDGSVLDFIEGIGGLDTYSDHYFVLATEAASEELISLAVEKAVDEILVKPFSTDTIHQIVERYLEKQASAGQDWVLALRLAKTSLKEKRFQEAEELFAAVSRKFPSHPGVQLECAEFFLRRNLPQQSLLLLQEQLKNAPENARALHLTGQALKKVGRFTEAAEKMQRACVLSPLNSLRRAELAEIYCLMAEEQVQLALKNESENSALILSRAKYQLLRKEYAALVTYLDAKRAFLSESGKKEADAFVTLAKKLGGIR
jgi:predicted Zn-dependent protease